MTSGTPAQVGRPLSAPAVAAILDYLRDEIGFASFARDLAGHIAAQAHRVEQLEAALSEYLSADNATNDPESVRRYRNARERARALLPGVSP